MSGAVGNLLGNSGIFSSLLNLVAQAFPPLSIATSLANRLIDTVGDAVKDAVSTLIKESGAPKFLQELVNDVVDQALTGQRKPSDAAVDSFVGNDASVQDWLSDFGQELTQSIVEGSRRALEESGESSGSGKSSPKSWLQAIAASLGEALGKKAAKMVELTDKLDELVSAGEGLEGEEKQQNAQAFSATQAELQGVSQEFQIISNSLSTTLKAIGEGLGSIARKS